MNPFLLVHRHIHDYTPSAEAAAAWQNWFESLGDALVDPGNAVLDDRGVAGAAATPLPLGGYTIVNAETLEEAIRIARGCPAVSEGGAVEVGRLSPVPGRHHPARTF
jgi:YCII-related domain